MKIYSGPLSMFGAKAEIAAHEKGLAFELVMVPFSIATRYEPKHPEVARINPKAQVPVLVDGDLELFDSTQIFEYLEDLHPRPALWPAEPRARARARQLEHLSDEVFFPHVIALMGQIGPHPDRGVIEPATRAIADYCARMDVALGAKEFLAGDFSYADIAFYVAQFFGGFLGAPPSDDLARLVAWKRRMAAREAVARVVGPMRRFLSDNGVVAPE